MASFMEIHSVVPLDSDTSELQLLLLFFGWIFATIAITYGWFVGWDPETWIRDAASIITAGAAALPMSVVRIDTAAQAKSPPSNPPVSVAQAGSPALATDINAAATKRSSLQFQTKQWCWEQHSWAGRPGRFSPREELPVSTPIDPDRVQYLLEQPTMAQKRALRQKQRDEAVKKVIDEFWYGLAVETPLPRPLQPKRPFLGPPPGYQIQYEKFRSIFGADGCNDQSSSHETMPGHLQANLREFLPDLSIVQPSAGPVGIYDTTTTSFAPSENAPFRPQPTGMQSGHTPFNGGPAVASPAPHPVPNSYLQPPVAHVDSAPLRAPASNPPAPGPSNPVPTQPIAGPATPALPQQSSGGASVFGDGTVQSSAVSPFALMTVPIARAEVNKNMEAIHHDMKLVRSQIRTKGVAAGWKLHVGKQAFRGKLANYTRQLNDICDWAIAADGSVDETKLPRENWQQFGLDAEKLGELNQFLLDGWQYEGERLDKIIRASTRAVNLFV